jgi:hypothetical protein
MFWGGHCPVHSVRFSCGPGDASFVNTAAGQLTAIYSGLHPAAGTLQ